MSPAGRTTFVNTLCGKTVLGHKESDDPTTAHVEEGVKIKPVTVGTHTPPRHRESRCRMEC
jgi:cell division control protein 11